MGARVSIIEAVNGLTSILCTTLATGKHNRNNTNEPNVLGNHLNFLRVWTVLLLILVLSVLATPFAHNQKTPSAPVAAPLAPTGPVYQVSLDANSLSQTDVTVATNATQVMSFRIGAVINSSTTNPLTGVYGWQFGIIYNSTAFLPFGDPSPTSGYPDGAGNTALFGAQTTTGTVNWAGKIAGSQAFGSYALIPCNNPPCPYQEIQVFMTLLAPNPAVTISAKTLLANVNFELINKPGGPQYFNITDVKFATSDGTAIVGPTAGPSIIEGINNAPPIAHFNVSPAPNIGPFAFNFNATASFDPDGTISNPAGYFWDFGDGTQDLGQTGPMVTHDYGTGGNSIVTLRVQDTLGATGSARNGLGEPLANPQPSHEKRIVGTVSDLPPIAQFTFYPLNFTLIGFDASNSTDPDGRIIAYNWEFGDGYNVSTTSSFANHAYHFPGNYTVVLVVVDDANLTATVSQLVPVGTRGADIPPVAIIAWTPPNPTVGVEVRFSGNQSYDPDGQIQSYLWNFGDGTTFSGEVSIHTYSNSGNYTVTLTVTDNAGQVGIASVRLYVSPQGNDAPPIAIFHWSQTSYSPGHLDITFDGRFSYDPDGYIVNWAYSFGDAGYENGPVFQVTHAYPSPGNYTAMLTVTDNAGLSSSTTADIVVVQRSDQPPIASFAFSTGNATTGQTVYFNGGSSYDPDGYIQTWSWSFGDGFTDFGVQTSHAYTNPGTYTVTLIVTDNGGLSATASAVISVRSDIPPVASFSFTPANPTVGQQVFFAANASDPDGFIQQWNWSFGDGLSIIFASSFVSHTYNAPGNYTVTLTVVDNGGQSANASMTVSVRPRPMHDVAVVSVNVYPQRVVSSQSVGIQVVIANNGSSNETVTVTAYYNGNVIETLTGVFVPVPPQTCTFCNNNVYLQIIWDTTGVPAGNYTISATAFLPTDQNPTDNTKTDGTVQVLPPPILTVSPTSGAPGTTVTLHGSNFPPAPYYGGGIGYVEVTFDDQLIGFTSTYDGKFNFTFSIPLSESGHHLIKAIDQYSRAHADVRFEVLATSAPSTLTVTVQAGTIYFPSDTVVVYSQVTLNGQPTTPSTFQLQLFLPNGSVRILTSTSLGAGLYKAVYAVPKSGSLGTYLVLAKAHTTDPLDATSIASFEVKQSWLNSNSPKIVAGATLAAVLGLSVVAWQKGYFKKKEDEIPSF